MENQIIIELAGRDSFAAFLKYQKENEFRGAIPTLARAPSEHGSFEIILSELDWLKDKLSHRPFSISKPEFLEDHKLWWVLNGRYLSEIIHRYGFYTPCLGCHLYFHLLRAELALKKGVKKIISGERELHAEKVKINQTRLALEAYKEVLLGANLELVFPLQKISDNQEIENLLGKKWQEEASQLSCAFKANYCSVENQLLIQEEDLKPYLEEFLIPVGEIILKVKLNQNADYPLEVENYLRKKWTGR